MLRTLLTVVVAAAIGMYWKNDIADILVCTVAFFGVTEMGTVVSNSVVTTAATIFPIVAGVIIQSEVMKLESESLKIFVLDPFAFLLTFAVMFLDHCSNSPQYRFVFVVAVVRASQYIVETARDITVLQAVQGYAAVESFVLGIFIVLLIDWCYPIRKPPSHMVRKQFMEALRSLQSAFTLFTEGESHSEIVCHLVNAKRVLTSAKPLMVAAAQEPTLWRAPWRDDVADDLHVAISQLRNSFQILVEITREDEGSSKYDPEFGSGSSSQLNRQKKIWADPDVVAIKCCIDRDLSAAISAVDSALRDGFVRDNPFQSFGNNHYLGELPKDRWLRFMQSLNHQRRASLVKLSGEESRRYRTKSVLEDQTVRISVALQVGRSNWKNGNKMEKCRLFLEQMGAKLEK